MASPDISLSPAPIKRYYIDPLAAAWMQKHFGMRFVSWDSGKEYEDFMTIYNAGSPIEKIREGQRYVIHPDSLPLLTPRTDDKDEDGFVFCAKTQAWWREYGEDEDGQGLNRAKLPEDSVTAKRDGKLFFWPESEKA